MYYFIINPNSRSGAGESIWNQLRRELLLKGISFESYLTRYVGHATKIAGQITQKATPEHPVTLIAVGGDGTIQEVLNGIFNLDSVIFGYIPTGSGNDFCRGMQLPQEPLAALDSILKKERMIEMDLPFTIQNGKRYRFGISTGLGYDAAVCQEVLATPFKKVFNRLKLGKLIYLFIALKQLVFLNLAPMTITLDGNRRYHYDRVYFAAVMNQKYEGGGFMFCPDARPDDGMLDVIVAEGINRLKLLFCLPTAFFGKHTHVKGIHIFRCRSIDIHSSVPLPVHRDGESGGIQNEFFVTFEKKPLKIIMPVL